MIFGFYDPTGNCNNMHERVVVHGVNGFATRIILWLNDQPIIDMIEDLTAEI